MYALFFIALKFPVHFSDLSEAFSSSRILKVFLVPRIRDNGNYVSRLLLRVNGRQRAVMRGHVLLPFATTAGDCMLCTDCYAMQVP